MPYAVPKVPVMFGASIDHPLVSLMIRPGAWKDAAAVSSAVFRSHEGNVPEVNAQFYTNTSTYSYYAYNARMFRSLGAYRRKVLDTESKNLGWPLLRMPVLYHSDDPQDESIEGEVGDGGDVWMMRRRRWHRRWLLM